MKKILIAMPDELHKQLKIHAIHTNKTLNDICCGFINDAFNKMTPVESREQINTIQMYGSNNTKAKKSKTRSR